MGIFIQKGDQWMSYPMQATFVSLANPDKDGKFTVTCRFNKQDQANMNGFSEVMRDFITQNFPPNFQLGYRSQPVKDGDTEAKEKYRGCKYINFKSAYPVQSVGPDNKFIDVTHIDRGDIIQVMFSIYKWEFQGQHGISFGLGNLKLLKKATAEQRAEWGGGSRDPESDFGDVSVPQDQGSFFDVSGTFDPTQPPTTTQAAPQGAPGGDFMNPGPAPQTQQAATQPQTQAAPPVQQAPAQSAPAQSAPGEAPQSLPFDDSGIPF